jgi:predicted dehydrogenase
MSTLNICIVGFGYWGKNFLRILQNQNNKFKLTAVVEENIDKVKYLEKDGIKVYKSVNDLLNSDTLVDCAIVATNTSVHYEITKKLLENSIHCLVEKPLTTSLSEAKDLFQKSEEYERSLMVDYTFLYDDGISALRNIVLSGELGNIMHISFERSNLGPIRTDTNTAWDLSTHDLSILLSLTEEYPIEIKALGRAFLNPGIEDIVNISINFDSMFATIFSSWLHPEKTRIIKVVGDKKMAVWNNLDPEQELKIYNKSVVASENDLDYAMNLYKIKSGEVVIPYIEKEEPLKKVVIDFYNRIKGESNQIINSKELTLKITAIMEKINIDLKNN